MCKGGRAKRQAVRASPFRSSLTSRSDFFLLCRARQGTDVGRIAQTRSSSSFRPKPLGIGGISGGIDPLQKPEFCAECALQRTIWGSPPPP